MQELSSSRYAQRRPGQKLHHVWASGEFVAAKAACGRTFAPDLGRWRMTVNVTLGHYCQSCRRVVG